jgi:hypothetical protein
MGLFLELIPIMSFFFVFSRSCIYYRPKYKNVKHRNPSSNNRLTTSKKGKWIVQDIHRNWLLCKRCFEDGFLPSSGQKTEITVHRRETVRHIFLLVILTKKSVRSVRFEEVINTQLVNKFATFHKTESSLPCLSSTT